MMIIFVEPSLHVNKLQCPRGKLGDLPILLVIYDQPLFLRAKRHATAKNNARQIKICLWEDHPKLARDW